MGRSAWTVLAMVAALAALIGAALWAASPATTGSGDDTVTAQRDAEPERAAPTDAALDARRRVGAPARVTGEVRSAGDGRPVAGQRVVLAGQQRVPEVETDARGAFAFAEVPHGGPYEVVVSAAGCADVRVPGIEL